MTFETNDNYSIQFEMKKHYSHSTTDKLTRVYAVTFPSCLCGDKITLRDVN